MQQTAGRALARPAGLTHLWRQVVNSRGSKVLLKISGMVLLTGISLSAPPSLADDTRGVLRKPLPAKDLASTRGGTDFKTVTNLNDVRGTVQNNSAMNVVTGNNAISSSFAGANGIPMVIQNTGNNVLIQNATIVNVQLQP
jgi:hypothetical protein